MEIYLIRHGIAQDPSPHQADQDRALTTAGRHKLEAIGQRLQGLNLRFDHLITSPLRRAQETAGILVQMGLSPTVEVWDGLCPGKPIEGLLERGEDPRLLNLQCLGLVGHEPDLSHWAAQLLWGAGTSGGCFELKKAGIVGIHVPQWSRTLLRTGQLFWLTPPRFLL